MVNQHSQHLCIYSNPTHVGKYVMRVTARHFRVPSTLMPQLFTTKATTFTKPNHSAFCDRPWVICHGTWQCIPAVGKPCAIAMTSKPHQNYQPIARFQYLDFLLFCGRAMSAPRTRQIYKLNVAFLSALSYYRSSGH